MFLERVSSRFMHLHNFSTESARIFFTVLMGEQDIFTSITLNHVGLGVNLDKKVTGAVGCLIRKHIRIVNGKQVKSPVTKTFEHAAVNIEKCVSVTYEMAGLLCEAFAVISIFFRNTPPVAPFGAISPPKDFAVKNQIHFYDKSTGAILATHSLLVQKGVSVSDQERALKELLSETAAELGLKASQIATIDSGSRKLPTDGQFKVDLATKKLKRLTGKSTFVQS